MSFSSLPLTGQNPRVWHWAASAGRHKEQEQSDGSSSVNRGTCPLPHTGGYRWQAAVSDVPGMGTLPIIYLKTSLEYKGCCVHVAKETLNVFMKKYICIIFPCSPVQL